MPGIKRRSTKLLQSLYYAPLIKYIIKCNGNKEADLVHLYLYIRGSGWGGLVFTIH